VNRKKKRLTFSALAIYEDLRGRGRTGVLDFWFRGQENKREKGGQLGQPRSGGIKPNGGRRKIPRMVPRPILPRRGSVKRGRKAGGRLVRALLMGGERVDR